MPNKINQLMCITTRHHKLSITNLSFLHVAAGAAGLR